MKKRNYLVCAFGSGLSDMLQTLGIDQIPLKSWLDFDRMNISFDDGAFGVIDLTGLTPAQIYAKGLEDAEGWMEIDYLEPRLDKLTKEEVKQAKERKEWLDLAKENGGISEAIFEATENDLDIIFYDGHLLVGYNPEEGTYICYSVATLFEELAEAGDEDSSN